jgi:hypothetical protein
MATRTRRTAAIVATASTAIALGAWGGQPATSRPHAGNGVGALPASEILKKAASALASVGTLEVKGALHAGPEGINFSVKSTARGKDVSGTISIHTTTTSLGPVHFIAIGSVLYLEAAAAFWRQEITSGKNAPTGAALTTIVDKSAGRWIEITGAEAKSFASGFGDLTEPGKFAQSLLSGSDTWAKGTPTTRRGHQVLPIISSTSGTIYVSLTGAPLPMEIMGSVAIGTASVSTDVTIGYPASLAIAAPKGAVTFATIDQSSAG